MKNTFKTDHDGNIIQNLMPLFTTTKTWEE